MTYRVYFNRELEWPQCWSVDEGDQTSEVNVVGFVIEGCKVASRNLDAARERSSAVHRLDKPFAWIEIEASSFTVSKGIATFHA